MSQATESAPYPAGNHSSPCPLCQGQGKGWEENRFYRCEQCRGIFRAREYLPSPALERYTYEQHQNDVEDPRYQHFVSPITQAVLRDFGPEHEGLDFGAGTGPVISKVLIDHGFHIHPYDPFFCPVPALLEKTYDYIVCCEVIEHFHEPAREFSLLHRMLKPQGRLYCMTHLYDESINFGKWYYQTDPTHVFFYQAATMSWICEAFGFSELRIDGRLVEMMRGEM